MAERRLVYDGPSSIGFVQIFEGDIIEFYGHPFTTRDGPCIAFFSDDHTRVSGPDISFRLKNWDGCAREYSPQDCHSLHFSKLKSVVRQVPKLSGFGKFSKSLKERGL